jgi:hypothetical protein
MNISLNFKGIEVVHCLYGIDIFVDHSDNIFKVIWREDTLF